MPKPNVADCAVWVNDIEIGNNFLSLFISDAMKILQRMK
jgi:hypothetical protein